MLRAALILVVCFVGCEFAQHREESPPIEDSTPATENAQEPAVDAPVPALSNASTTSSNTETAVPAVEKQNPPAAPAEESRAELLIHKEPDRFYTVKAGDTLLSIARAFETTAPALRRANPELTGDKLLIGYRLRLPSGKKPVRAIENKPRQ